MEQRNEETKRSCLGMSANTNSTLGSVRSSKNFCHLFCKLLRKKLMFHVRGCTTCILSYSIFHFCFVWNFNFWHWWRMLNYSFIFTGRYHSKSNNKTHSREKKHCSHRRTSRGTCTGANERSLETTYCFLRSIVQSIHESQTVTKRIYNQISVGIDSGVPQSWPLLSLTLLLIITRATIFVLTGQSVISCYHATISTPDSDLTAPLPLLGAFNELFTSRLNIDKFCVNLRSINSYMLKTTRCTSRGLHRDAKD